MIAVHEFINGTTTEYAENNQEFLDSIFTPGGTLAVFKKIQNRKNDILYFVDDVHGYFERKTDGLFGKFGTEHELTLTRIYDAETCHWLGATTEKVITTIHARACSELERFLNILK